MNTKFYHTNIEQVVSLIENRIQHLKDNEGTGMTRYANLVRKFELENIIDQIGRMETDAICGSVDTILEELKHD